MYKKMFNFTNFWSDANKSYNEVSPYTVQNDHQKSTNKLGDQKKKKIYE